MSTRGFWELPSLYHTHWDPIWARAQERGMPCNFHIGSGGLGGNLVWEGTPVERTLSTIAAVLFLNNGRCLANLIFSGLLDRFPELKFVSVESGVGWLPFLLDACEYQMNESVPEGVMKLRPTEYFQRQIYASFWFETDVAGPIEKLGENNVMFETDFPHPTCLYPNPRRARDERGLGFRASDRAEDSLRERRARLPAGAPEVGTPTGAVRARWCTSEARQAVSYSPARSSA